MKKKTPKTPTDLKKVESVFRGGDKCDRCGRRTDMTMQVSDGTYACECCLEIVEAEIERQKEIERQEDSEFYLDDKHVGEQW